MSCTRLGNRFHMHIDISVVLETALLYSKMKRINGIANFERKMEVEVLESGFPFFYKRKSESHQYMESSRLQYTWALFKPRLRLKGTQNQARFRSKL